MVDGGGVTPSPIDIAVGRGGILSRVFEPERAETLFQPRIQAFLTAPIEQFGKYGIHERFEMVRVAYGRSAKSVPNVGEFAVFDAVETNVGHLARLLRSMPTNRQGAERGTFRLARKHQARASPYLKLGRVCEDAEGLTQPDAAQFLLQV